jgi:uncharacterized protein (UPF0305 family)
MICQLLKELELMLIRKMMYSLTKYLWDENRDFYINYFNNLINNVNDIDLSQNKY